MTTQAERATGLPIPRLPRDVETPAVVVDRGRLEGNIARLQDAMDERRVAVRPHAKTHKSVRIAGLQLEAGAKGITVGTIGEAEVFAAAGITDLFLAYPVWAEGAKAVRLRDVHDSAELRVGVDSEEGAERLAAAVAGARRPLRVLVEIDPGLHRTGVAHPEDAVRVARTSRALGLVVDGVFAHGGHGYDPAKRTRAAEEEVASLDAAARALEDAGFEVRTISAGSTPTMIASATGRVNEMRAGTYVLGDRQQWALGAIPAEGVAAVVAATVVSVAREHFVLDSGAKTLTKDRAEWLTGYGALPAYPDAVIERLSDYHAVVRPGSDARPHLGEIVAVAPNHICPVIDLFEAFWVIGPGGATERWPVDARGRSS